VPIFVLFLDVQDYLSMQDQYRRRVRGRKVRIFGFYGTIFGNVEGERPSASVAAAAHEKEDRVWA
jgi:hypothetical protein